jgi:hypothetical protein
MDSIFGPNDTHSAYSPRHGEVAYPSVDVPSGLRSLIGSTCDP